MTTAAVERRDIVVEAQATGMVEPVDTVAVKSIAGGLVTRMPVEVGSMVKPGDLLVQIDTRDVRNQYEQARANLASAQAQLTVATAARTASSARRAAHHTAAEARGDRVVRRAQAAVVTARTTSNRGQRLEQATCRAGGRHGDRKQARWAPCTSAPSASGGTTLYHRDRRACGASRRDETDSQRAGGAEARGPGTPSRQALHRPVEKIEPRPWSRRAAMFVWSR